MIKRIVNLTLELTSDTGIKKQACYYSKESSKRSDVSIMAVFCCLSTCTFWHLSMNRKCLCWGYGLQHHMSRGPGGVLLTCASGNRQTEPGMGSETNKNLLSDYNRSSMRHLEDTDLSRYSQLRKTIKKSRFLEKFQSSTEAK